MNTTLYLPSQYRQDHDHILSKIQLFLIDEVSRSCRQSIVLLNIAQVHLLNESRGSTLEVVVSRMKLRGSAVRFIVVSATVPNVIDVADWIANRTNDGPATVMEVCFMFYHYEESANPNHLLHRSSARNSDRANFRGLSMAFPGVATRTTSCSQRHLTTSCTVFCNSIATINRSSYSAQRGKVRPSGSRAVVCRSYDWQFKGL